MTYRKFRQEFISRLPTANIFSPSEFAFGKPTSPIRRRHYAFPSGGRGTALAVDEVFPFRQALPDTITHQRCISFATRQISYRLCDISYLQSKYFIYSVRNLYPVRQHPCRGRRPRRPSRCRQATSLPCSHPPKPPLPKGIAKQWAR